MAEMIWYWEVIVIGGERGFEKAGWYAPIQYGAKDFINLREMTVQYTGSLNVAV